MSWPLVGSGDAASSRGCPSFKSQAEAQTYFVEAGGSIDHGIGKLDRDHDGVACEGLSGPFAGYATLGYNRAFGERHAVDVSWRRAQSSVQNAVEPASGSDLRYTVNQYALAYLARF